MIMKHFLLPTLFLFAAFSLQAQTVSDFENVKLAEGTPYWNGVDLGDGVDYDATISYKSGASMFPMSTSVSYGYGNLSGFVLSQATDTEAMSANAPYSSIKGCGVDGSSKYAVCIIDPSKDLPIVTVAGEYDDARVISGCYISPTADLPYYLENGRGFMDRNPYAEGDWLAVVATGYDAAGNATGTATIYLADYRDASKADKWLKDWAWFDLTSLGAVKKKQLRPFCQRKPRSFLQQPSADDYQFLYGQFRGNLPHPIRHQGECHHKNCQDAILFHRGWQANPTATTWCECCQDRIHRRNHQH